MLPREKLACPPCSHYRSSKILKFRLGEGGVAGGGVGHQWHNLMRFSHSRPLCEDTNKQRPTNGLRLRAIYWYLCDSATLVRTSVIIGLMVPNCKQRHTYECTVISLCILIQEKNVKWKRRVKHMCRDEILRNDTDRERRGRLWRHVGREVVWALCIWFSHSVCVMCVSECVWQRGWNVGRPHRE